MEGRGRAGQALPGTLSADLLQCRRMLLAALQ
jgi:hypothetical protein